MGCEKHREPPEAIPSLALRACTVEFSVTDVLNTSPTRERGNDRHGLRETPRAPRSDPLACASGLYGRILDPYHRQEIPTAALWAQASFLVDFNGPHPYVEIVRRRSTSDRNSERANRGSVRVEVLFLQSTEGTRSTHATRDKADMGRGDPGRLAGVGLGVRRRPHSRANPQGPRRGQAFRTWTGPSSKTEPTSENTSPRRAEVGERARRADWELYKTSPDNENSSNSCPSTGGVRSQAGSGQGSSSRKSTTYSPIPRMRSFLSRRPSSRLDSRWSYRTAPKSTWRRSTRSSRWLPRIRASRVCSTRRGSSRPTNRPRRRSRIASSRSSRPARSSIRSRGVGVSARASASRSSLEFTDAVKGSTVSIQGLKGKVVVVDFWATWCGPCVAEMPKMKEIYGKYHDRGVEFIGVSLDQPKEAGGLDKLKEYVEKNEIAWPQYYQGNGWASEFSKKWGIQLHPEHVRRRRRRQALLGRGPRQTRDPDPRVAREEVRRRARRRLSRFGLDPNQPLAQRTACRRRPSGRTRRPLFEAQQSGCRASSRRTVGPAHRSRRFGRTGVKLDVESASAPGRCLASRRAAALPASSFPCDAPARIARRPTPGEERDDPWPATTSRPTYAGFATSGSSRTSTPARRRPPSGFSTTPARSTGWATSTRGRRPPTTARKNASAGSPSSPPRSPATGRTPRASRRRSTSSTRPATSTSRPRSSGRSACSTAPS